MANRFTKDELDWRFRKWCNKHGTEWTDMLKARTKDLQSVNYAMPMQNMREVMNHAYRAGFQEGARLERIKAREKARQQSSERGVE